MGVINLQNLPTLYMMLSKGYTPEGNTEKKYYQSPNLFKSADQVERGG